MLDYSELENALPAEMRARWQSLLERFREMQSVVVAFSGGVDSGLLCAAGYRALGDHMLAVTVRSPVESMGDVESAQALADQAGFPLRIVDYDDLSDPEFVSNAPNRCYTCKLTRFKMLRHLADEEGFSILVEGSNADDLNDYRPGRQAVIETGTTSPLLELGFRKDEIRALSKAFGLTVWNRSSAPCLATRFPYGTPVTHEGLKIVTEGEKYLHGLGFSIVRVRHHGVLARLEVAPHEVGRLVEMRTQVSAYFKTLGFNYVTVDLDGYRLGSLNEVLK